MVCRVAPLLDSPTTRPGQGCWEVSHTCSPTVHQSHVSEALPQQRPREVPWRSSMLHGAGAASKGEV